ncbi:hypothetical protein ES703_63248 [subsurface metagenome]
MQWLVKLVLEAIGVPPVFINRGDSEFLDFGMMDFDQSPGWKNLDCSGIVPSNASAIAFWFDGFSPTVESTVSFFVGGHAHIPNSCVLIAQVANILNNGDFVLPIGPDGIVQYGFATNDWEFIGMFIKGWWL